MRLQRFIGDFDLGKKVLAVSDAKFYNQIKNVLRLEPGSALVLCDGKDNEAEAQILSISKNDVELKIGKVEANKNEPEIDAVLYCAILKRENFEFVVQKATEIGIKKIVPIITKRTVKLSLNMERLETITKEAAEQSGRGIIPEISKPISFENTCKDASSNGSNYFFDISGKSASSIKKASSVGLFIGPEGGWDEGEIKLALNNGFNIVTLGRLTLRAETAAIVASYISVSQIK